MPDNKDQLDYLANRLAQGTMPRNAKYIFSKSDWDTFRIEVNNLIATEVAEATRLARIDENEPYANHNIQEVKAYANDRIAVLQPSQLEKEGK